MGEFLAAGMMESLGCLAADFVQRLDAVDGKAWVDDGDRFHAVFGQFLDRLVGVGLQPFLRAEARLEGGDQFLSSHPSLSRNSRVVFWQWQ